MAIPENVQACRDFLKGSITAFEKQGQREKDDLAFLTPLGQWPEAVQNQRAATSVAGIPIPARPMLSVAPIHEPITLVINQEKAAHLGVSVHALNEDASDDTAAVVQGLYRTIERTSRASIARDWAYNRSAKAGLGAYRIVKDYDRDTGVPGDQKIVIKRILHQTSVYRDPFAQEPDFSDADKGAIIEDMSFAKYKRLYPTSELAQYDEGQLMALAKDSPITETQGWVGGEKDTRTVRIAEFFWTTYEDVVTTEKNWKNEDVKVRQQTRQVHQIKCNAIEELERDDNWGCYIPIITTLGEEVQPFDNERRWIGMVHNAKDGARLTNYAASNAVEMAAMDPKAPFELDPLQIEGYETFWQQANIRNWPYLPFKRIIDGQDYGKPERTQTDTARLSPSMMLLSMGRDFVQSATATYDPALGKQPTAHRSGRALVALQDQTVEATSGYLDNLAQISMTYEAMVILDLIPKVYDRPGRIVKILDKEYQPKPVILNAPFAPGPDGKPLELPYEAPADKAQADAAVADPQHPAKFYDLNKGRYGVEVSIKKSYKDQREEGATEMGNILQADPQLIQVIGPEYFEYRGEPWAEKIAGILKRNRDHAMPWLSDQPQNQPTAQQAAQLAQENQALKQQLGQAAEMVKGKAMETDAKVKIATMQEQAESERAHEANEVKLAVAELGAKVERLALFLEERARLGVQAHEVAMSGVEHAQGLEAADQQHQQTVAQADQGVAGQMAMAQQSAALQPPPVAPDEGSGESER